MKILITGARGFVGKNLSRILKNGGHEVVGLSASAEAPFSQYSWRDLDAGTLPRDAFDAVIHLAGKAHDLKNRAGAQVYFDVNTELTKKIFRHFAESSATRFFFFSSVKAAADSVPAGELTEDAVPAPVGPYGESKLAAENFIRENFDFRGNAADGRRVYVIRPCMIHGPENKGNLNLLYAAAKLGVPFPLGAFDNRRSFLSIGNLGFILSAMLEKSPESGIYNVADDEAVSSAELVRVICGALGKKARIVNVPAAWLRFAAAAGTLLHLPLNKDRLTKLTENYAVSNAKIKRALGIENLPVPVREGLAETIRSFERKR